MRLHAVKSFYDNRMGLVTLEDDVLSIVSQVRERYGDRISVQLDPDTGAYHFVEHCEDSTDRLIFSTVELDGRCLDRLARADSQVASMWGVEDPYDAAEREQDEAQKLIDQELREGIREHGEELIFALQKGGKAPRLPTKVYIPRGIDADS